jgi:hypothetical protein
VPAFDAASFQVAVLKSMLIDARLKTVSSERAQQHLSESQTFSKRLGRGRTCASGLSMSKIKRVQELRFHALRFAGFV